MTTVLAISIRTARPIQVHLPALRPAHHARDVEAEETVEQRGAHADASVNPPEPADRATHPGDVHVIRGEHGRHGVVCKRVEEEEVCLEGYASLTLAECGQFVARALPELPVAKGRSGRPVELSRASAEEKGVGGARSLPS